MFQSLADRFLRKQCWFAARDHSIEKFHGVFIAALIRWPSRITLFPQKFQLFTGHDLPFVSHIRDSRGAFRADRQLQLVHSARQRFRENANRARYAVPHNSGCLDVLGGLTYPYADIWPSCSEGMDAIRIRLSERNEQRPLVDCFQRRLEKAGSETYRRRRACPLFCATRRPLIQVRPTALFGLIQSVASGQ